MRDASAVYLQLSSRSLWLVNNNYQLFNRSRVYVWTAFLNIQKMRYSSTNLIAIMDPIASKYSVWKRIIHRFQARRDIPFRKRFFVGYDLHGNTYWEFTIDGNMQRLRRKMEPFQEYIFKADYFSTVPPPWLQWLRRTRNTPPTLQELIDEQLRQRNIKVLANEADAKWESEKLQLEQQHRLKLQAELDKIKVEEEKPEFKTEELDREETAQESEVTKQDPKKDDPWAKANEAQQEGYNPIESANIPIRK